MITDLIETARVVMRPFEVSDVERAFAWFGDAEVMRFTVSGVDASVERTRERIEAYRAHHARRGFSRWVVVERASGLAIGDSGLLELEESGEIELGYRLARSHWGRGLATEAAAAWVQAAFERHRLERVIAFAHPENAASLTVLGKLGFRLERRGVVLGMESLIYALVPADRERSGPAALGG